MATKDKLVNLEDLKVVGDAVGDLKSATAELQDVQNHIVTVTQSKNLFDGEYTEHGYIGESDGVLYASPTSTSSYTDYIDVHNESGYITFSCVVSMANNSFRYAIYDESKQFVSGHIIVSDDMHVSGNRYYMVISITGGYYLRFSCKTTYAVNLVSHGKFMIEFGDTPTDYEAWSAGSYNITASAFIDDTAGNGNTDKTWSADKLHDEISMFQPSATDNDIGKALIVKTVDDGKATSYEFGETGGENPNLAIVESMTISYVPQKDLGFSMSDGTLKSLESNNIKKNYSLFFFGKITTFDELWIGHGTGSSGYYFVIDDTSVTPTTNGSSGTQFAHNLTIEDYISVQLTVGMLGKCSITVNTKGGSYTKDFTSGFNGNKGDIFVKSAGSALTDCNFDWACEDYKKRIWVFGDSYLGTTSNKRWPYWLLTWGHDTALLSGYAGENSEDSYTDLLQTLTHGTPKYLVWCLGMNDQDSSSAINANYKTYVELVMAKCEELGITLILATIPDVTQVPGSNNFKNAYVRASGYRYIDFADAVDGVSGWLDTDGVHPNEVGARLLCSMALSSVPELLLTP